MTTLAVSADAILAQRCRADFWAFVRVFWHTVPGAAKLIPNWHMEVICKELQELAIRVHAGLPKEYDLVINQPPGTSKSSLATILYHPWVWTFFPQARFLCASHTSELVLDLATKARSVITSDLYRRLFDDIELSEDTDTKGLYRNNFGGDRLSCTVAGKTPTGQHAHFHLVDDALDPKKARSEVEKMTARDFMTEVLPSRKVDKAITPLILVMQRLGVGDPTDVVLEMSRKEHGTPVRHFCMPDELTELVSPPELRAYYEANGGLFDPIRLSRTVMARERASMGAHAYDTQYGQRATVRGGGRFRREWFNNRCKAAPYKARRIRYTDRASTMNGGCATASALIAKSAEGAYYVEHVVKGHWEPDERNKVLRATALRDRARYGPQNEPRIYIEAEGGSSGRDAWLGVVRALEGFPVFEDRVTGSKDVRAEPWASQLASGNVWIVDNGESEGTGVADWDIEGFIREHELFQPDVTVKRLGGFKDQVDACCLLASALVDTQRGRIAVADVLPGDFVVTLGGLREVLWSGQSGVASSFLEVLTESGHVLCATPGHLVWTHDAGYTRIEDLQPHNQLSVMGAPAWTTGRGRQTPASTCLSSGFRATHTTGGSGVRITGAREGKSPSTSLCGSTIRVTYPLAIRFITRTRTQRTTTSLIWSASHPRNMPPGTQTGATSQDKRSIWLPYVPLRQNGTGARRGGSGTVSMPARHSLVGSLVNSPVLSVLPCSSRSAMEQKRAGRDSVPLLASTRTGSEAGLGRMCKSNALLVSRFLQGRSAADSALENAPCGSGGTVPVYDLTVAQAHQFYSDGVLVHNSGAFNLLSGINVNSIPLRVIDLGKRNAGRAKVLFCSEAELPSILIDRPALLVHIGDASPLPERQPDMPVHGLSRLMGRVWVRFADIDPAEVQDRWNEAIPHIGLKPEQCILTKEIARKVWGFLLKRTDPPYEAVVFCSETADRRARTLAYAFVDSLGYRRNEVILSHDGMYSNYDGPPPNNHIYAMFKAGRAGMMG